MIIDRKEYKITWVDYDEELDELNSNLDIHVEFKNGKKYVATFFTIKNIYSLFEKNKTSGECANGTYFWATDMVIIASMTKENIVITVENLINENEFELIFDGPFQG